MAVARRGRITLAWEPVEGALKYHVKRGATPGGPYSTIDAATSGAGAVDETAGMGTVYYVVTAANDDGESAPSNEATAVLVAAPPAPGSLAAHPGSARISLTWAAVPEAESYIVWRSLVSGSGYERIANDLAATIHVDAGVANGTDYFYVVNAVNAGGASDWSNEVRSTPVPPPAAPTDLAARPGNAQITLQWAASAGAERYRVERAPTPEGPFVTVGVAETSSYVDRGLENGSTYHYGVIAVNASGESPPSPRASATATAPPPAPTHVAAVPGDGEVALSWSAPEGARQYRIKRSIDRRGPYKQIGSSTESRFVDRNVTNGSVYFYIVSALNDGGTGAYSSRAHATPVAPPPPPPPPVAPVPPMEEAVDPSLKVPIPPPRRGPSSSLDLEKLLDLRRIEALRQIFKSTAQKIEVWEVLWLVSKGGYEARRGIERLVRLKDAGDSPVLVDEAATFFEQILKARSQAGALVEGIRKFVGSLNMGGSDGGAMDVALGLIVSSAKSRQRAEEWLKSPLECRPEAAAYMEHALALAGRYLEGMESAR